MEKYFFVNANNEQQGPVDASALASLGVTATTLVWKDGMANWTPAGQIAELASYIQPSAAVQQPQYAQPQFAQPQYGGDSNAVPERPNNGLGLAIAFTILCCFPFGIPAIVNAAKVDSFYDRGEYQQAEDAAQKAKKWTWISFWAAVVCWAFYALLILISLNA